MNLLTDCRLKISNISIAEIKPHKNCLQNSINIMQTKNLSIHAVISHHFKFEKVKLIYDEINLLS